jgi:hypothetical protein
MWSHIIRASLALIAALQLSAAVAAEHSNSWILPAYAAGHEPEVDFSGNVRPPIFTFFPPMAGWCEGRTANIGLPVVFDLGEPQPAPVVHFLAQPALDDQVTAERVRVCLSGFSTLPPEHDSRTIQLVSIVNSQQSDITALRREVSSLSSDVSSMRGQISSLQQAISQALTERAGLQGQLGAAIAHLAKCRQRNADFQADNARLRSALSAAESKSRTCPNG